jgi:hypothetical protein
MVLTLKKKNIFYIAIITNIFMVAKPIIVDRILATIYHPQENAIIIQSDLEHSFDGQTRSVDDLINDALVLIDAHRYKIQVTQDEVDRYFAKILHANNLTSQQFEQVLQDQGFSINDGQEFLKKRLTIEQMIDFKVRSNKKMMIQQQNIDDYFDQHSKLHDQEFTLAIATIPSNNQSLETIQKKVDTPAFLDTLTFDEPFVVKASELPAERQFIKDKKDNSIVLIEPVDDTYEITKLIKQHVFTSHDCNNEIVMTIREQRFKSIINSYYEELRNSATIVIYP